MTLFLLIVASSLLFAIYRKTRPGWGRSGPFLPDAFVIGLTLYAVGALIVIWEGEYPAASVVATMGFTALAAGLVGAIAFVVMTRQLYEYLDFKRLHQNTMRHSREGTFIQIAIFAAVLVCLFFLYRVFTSGLLAPFLTLANIAQHSSLSIARNAMTSGSAGYFAPGYVKQFRDILLPIAISALVLTDPHPFRRPLVLGAILFAIAAMLVAGQRFIVVVLLLNLAFAGYYATAIRHLDEPGYRMKWSRFVLVGLLIGGLFGGLSFALGRTDPDQMKANVVSREAKIPIPVVGDMVDRIVLVWPRENAETYDAWHVVERGSGQPWGAEFSGLFYRTTDPAKINMEHLSNFLMSQTGGGSLGNSPLGLAPLAWLSYGWPGLIIAPILFVLFLGVLDIILMSEESSFFFGVKLYLFVVIPICASPFLFILYGGAIAAFLVIAVKSIRALTVSKTLARATL
jgi:hypothetical protein